MDVYTATEQAYRNGYENGIVDIVNYLKENSCFYDIDNYHSFRAIDIDDLDDLVKDFFNKGI
jgi:hypothetical protein